MEYYSSSSLQQWLSTLLLLLLISSITISFYLLIRRSRGTTPHGRPSPPKVPGAWPLIGHLHLLGGNHPLHIVLGTMSDKYGPIFTMLFGKHPSLVVSSSQFAKECFTSTNDKLFSYRHVPTGVKHMFYNNDSFGFAPYGSYWREMRKMNSLSLFSHHRVERLNRIRTFQLNIWFKNLYEMCNKEKSTTSTEGVVVEMKSWFDEMFFHVLVNMIVKPTNDDEGLVNKYRDVAKEAGHLLSSMAVSDMVPSLGWLDHLFGLVSKMKKTAKDMDSILTTWLEQHKSSQQLRSNGRADQTEEEKEEEKGLIAELLSMPDSALFGHNRDIVIKSACQALIMAGSDSTSATLTWVLSLLLNHREVLKKAQKELDQVVGKDRQVDDSDIKDLVYLQAILKETMRLYPTAPILERLAVEDCIVGGFHVQAGTTLFVNVSKVQRDPNLWTDPSEFEPERFLTGSNADVDLKGQDYELIPFGSGRRSCPAVSFSVRIMLLVLALFIHSFEVKLVGDGILDMTESSGHTNCRSSPLEVLISPRLDSKIYG
uniref:CYP82BF1 n=1 Tax=Corydalis yanhusuo TaxID=458692 RepID=A0AA96NAL1_9MAGN|nr:CYP82BF1 [Corydalis yanhusuo]